MNYLENYIANPPVKQINTTTQTAENKKDKVSNLSFKGDKKKIALALAGMAAVGIAGVLIYKKISLPKKILQESIGLQDEAVNILKESDAVTEEASTILTDAQKLVKETTLKIKEALKSSPEKIKEEDGQKVFEELQEGILKRKSLFTLENNEVIINTIETYKENGLKDIIKLRNHSIDVLLGLKEFTDGAREWAKGFFFQDGKLSAFVRNSKELADGTKEAAKIFYFEDGKFSEFTRDFKKLADGTMEAAKSFFFEDGKLFAFARNSKELADGTAEKAKKFFFINGELAVFIKDSKILADGTRESAKEFYFDGGKLKCWKNVTL